MAQNDFKSFAVGAGANVTPQADWEVLAALVTGFQSGKASSAQINKAIRQASFIAAALAQYTSDKTGGDVLDDGDQAAFITKMAAAFGKDFQPLDATLTALAGLTGAADKLPYFNGADTAALTALTAFAREILAQTDAAGVLSKLGLGNLVNALIKTNNLGDLPDKALSRTNLGVPKGVDKQMANEWAVLSGITTVTIGDSLGISSIVRTALGTYVVNLSKPYSSINYAVMGRFVPSASDNSLAYDGHELNITGKTTSSFTLLCPADYGADYRLRDASEL
uniref:hypothetical protein n=1 Tax=Kluyvera georgiana TaxID=73098 RepID=UPI00080709DA